MTKFEEEHIKFNNEYGNCKSAYYQKAVRHHFKNWHSEEEFQEMKESYWNQAESILSMLEEIKSLKSQLQQQALPVVPECVAEWIEDLKNKGYGPLKNPGTYGEAISDLSDESLEKILTWISQHQEEFMRAWLDGYTVEKPQLFYLKHIDMSKCSRYFDFYLEYDGNESMEHKRVDKGEKPGMGYEKSYYTFTQQEIDSMQTGSYEQIPVPVEDNK
ncbi:DUF1642 domain-containing protein [Lactococcus lactis]|uniref:DUF1642 domain-containing protein n=1 Tax=Lactococcus lactis TaxID=1358 RepID=UPI003562A7FF